jgi:ElaB/YqjD/DUF883 family membrane-anchored ribosome-binding protein
LQPVGTTTKGSRLWDAAGFWRAEIEDMRIQRNGVIEVAGEARDALSETAQAVKDTTTDLGAKAVGMSVRAGEYARSAGRQASAAAQSAYSTGGEARDMVETFTRENVWGSLVLAAALGYGIACLVKIGRGV